ncbi:MAG: Gfo/Idh/MocA family oxidoreductase [Candidatus Helarchaeota archaeon]|nr:Gfo/Idh/MocA family oxidoreductase [Candidatus Helarchaeota archaeon]
MDPVKFGIIGCGIAARFHILGLRNVTNPKYKFIAAHDINEKVLTRFSKAHKLTPYDTLESLLQSDIDAVLILLPHYLHARITKVAAEAGKHVLCEKPMAPTLEECDEMIAVTKKAGVKFMIAENHRFLPAHLYIKNLLERDFIGDVFLINTYEGAYDDPEHFLNPDIWHFTYDKGGGGVLADQGAHKFTLLNWLLDDTVESAQAWCAKTLNSPPNKGEDNAMIFLRFKKGAIAEVTVSTSAIHTPYNSTEIHGTKGSILENHQWENPVKIFSSHKEAEKKGNWYGPREPPEHGIFPKYYMISTHGEDTHFAECILNNTQPEFTPEQAKDAVAVILLAYLSIKNKTITKMDELNKIAKNEGTGSILKGLEELTQKNYEFLNW